MTIKISNIKTKVDSLTKLNINEDNLALGKVIDDDKSQFHDEIVEICHALNVFSRQLAKSEKAYVEDQVSKKKVNAFDKLLEAYGGDYEAAMQKILEDANKVNSQKKPVDENNNNEETTAMNTTTYTDNEPTNDSAHASIYVNGSPYQPNN